uniref:Uncharacterized protein n=1 Tax=Molossus molossus TaxID=27622 RepID=A0A7J8E370_MOLMO|nr:hypothetical protein HJG59_009040 [Molossus molossus]
MLRRPCASGLCTKKCNAGMRVPDNTVVADAVGGLTLSQLRVRLTFSCRCLTLPEDLACGPTPPVFGLASTEGLLSPGVWGQWPQRPCLSVGITEGHVLQSLLHSLVGLGSNCPQGHLASKHPGYWLPSLPGLTSPLPY